ncbi:MAG TPA: hypothetical protein VEC19_06695 [Usitatibacter sp.]|nr:hypothetical protein [Usitatibacter sp.]
MDFLHDKKTKTYLCEACAAHPGGIDGHASLKLEPSESASADGHATFACIRCDALWTRTYDGGGAFSWKLQPAGAKWPGKR